MRRHGDGGYLRRGEDAAAHGGPLVGIVIALTAQRLYPKDYALDKTKALLREPTTHEAIVSGGSLNFIKSQWKGELEQFKKRRTKFLIYK